MGNELKKYGRDVFFKNSYFLGIKKNLQRSHKTWSCYLQFHQDEWLTWKPAKANVASSWKIVNLGIVFEVTYPGYMGFPMEYFYKQAHFDRVIMSTNKQGLGRVEKLSWNWMMSVMEGLLKLISFLFKQNEGKKVVNCTLWLRKYKFIVHHKSHHLTC